MVFMLIDRENEIYQGLVRYENDHAKKHNAKLTVMENGRHCFHTEDRCTFGWMYNGNIKNLFIYWFYKE